MSMDSELHAVRLAPMIHTKLRTNERRNSRTLKKKRVPALQGGRVSYRGTDERLEVASGVIEPGTVGAMRIGIKADCGPVEFF